MTLHEMVQRGAEALGELWAAGGASVTFHADERGGRRRPDGTVKLATARRTFEFAVEAKRQLNLADAARIVERAHHGSEKWLVVAARISSSVAAVLREGGVNYLDAAGNAHIENDSLFVHVEGRKWEPSKNPVRAFSGEGLKVIFVLLVDSKLVSEPYRRLAELSAVSHGVVQYTMNDLVRLGYVVRTGRTERRVVEATEMLNRWARGYVEALRPKLSEGTFAFSGAENGKRVREWQSIPLDSGEDLWGGEPAASYKTAHLRPGRLTVYTRSNRTTLMKRLRVAPSEDGALTVIQTFWTREIERAVPGAFDGKTVPDLVAYADLLSSEDPRNAEVAAMLHERTVPGLGRG